MVNRWCFFCTKFITMKRLLWSVGVLSVLSLGCGTNATQDAENQTEDSTPTQGNERAIALMNGFTMAFGTAWANGDPAGIAETFAADGVRIIGGAQEAFNGRAEIAASFGEVADGGKLQNTHVEIVTTDARFVSEDLVIGCGNFQIMSEADEVLIEGKWGNTYRVEDGELRMLMESAYRSASVVDEAANANSTQELQEAWDCGTSEACAQVDANIASFVSSFNANAAEDVTLLFREDGIRSVSALPEIAIGREAILNSLQGDSSGVLSAEMTGFMEVGNNLVIAHGQWNVSGPDGSVAAFGHWGNLFETSETGALLVMESAGRYLVD